MDNHIAVIGVGRMGNSISDFLLSKNMQVTAITRTSAQADNLNEKWKKSVSRQCKYGVVNKDDAVALEAKYLATAAIEAIANADIIIESVNEDLETKRKIYSAISKYMKKSGIVASNSSSILPLELADGVIDASRLMGLHFFFPVSVSNLIELVTHSVLDEEAARRMRNFVRQCEMIMVEQKPENAFILNMLSMAVGGEAFRGAAKFGIAQANELSKSEIFPLGAFSLFDHVGIPVILEATKRYFDRDPLKNKQSYAKLMEFMQLMVSDDRSISLKFAEIEYPSALSGWIGDMPPLDDDPGEFSKRLFYLHINSCLFAVETGLISEDLLDVSIKAIMGTARGPMQLSREIGHSNLRDALNKYYSESCAEYYRPSSLLN